jgi:hypothetical protein
MYFVCPDVLVVLTGYGGSSSNGTVFTICLLIYLLLSKVRRQILSVSQINSCSSKGKPTVTSFPNMQSVALDYHTIHQLTHTAVTRLASYWTAGLRYLLITVFSFKSLCTQPLLPIPNGSRMYVERVNL